MKNRDLASGLFFLAVGILFIVGSFSFSIWDRYGPGPAFFPLVLGVVFSALSLLLFLASGFGKRAESEQLKESDSLGFSVIKRPLIYLCFLLGFYFLLELLGSFITIFLFMTGVLVSFARRSFRLVLTISIVTSLITYLLFTRLLGVPLPGGILQNVLRMY